MLDRESTDASGSWLPEEFRHARWPHFYIVGAPKCGTTALYSYLSRHPEIFMPELKEPHFFGRDLTDVHRPPRSIERYLDLFRTAKDDQLVGEASTSYLFSESAPKEIHEVRPSAKIIVMLRNPVDVMYAYHGAMTLGGFEFITDFSEALAAEPIRRERGLLPLRPGILDALFYRAIVNYPEHLTRYIEVFGKESVLVLIFEEFFKQPSLHFPLVLRFLGVDDGWAPAFEVSNPSRQVRSRRIHRFLATPPEFLNRIGYHLIPKRFHARLGQALLRANSKIGRRPPLPDEMWRNLRAEQEPRIRRLETILGRKLPW